MCTPARLQSDARGRDTRRRRSACGRLAGRAGVRVKGRAVRALAGGREEPQEAGRRQAAANAKRVLQRRSRKGERCEMERVYVI